LKHEQKDREAFLYVFVRACGSLSTTIVVMGHQPSLDKKTNEVATKSKQIESL